VGEFNRKTLGADLDQNFFLRHFFIHHRKLQAHVCNLGFFIYCNKVIQHIACQNHTHECENHTHEFKNHTHACGIAASQNPIWNPLVILR
jgi:hypothetical protein